MAQQIGQRVGKWNGGRWTASRQATGHWNHGRGQWNNGGRRFQPHPARQQAMTQPSSQDKIHEALSSLATVVKSLVSRVENIEGGSDRASGRPKAGQRVEAEPPHTHTTSSNPDFASVVRDVFRIVQIRHHEDNWTQLPKSLAKRLDKFASDINPPMPDEELRATVRKLTDDYSHRICETVRRHMESKRLEIEMSAARKERTDIDRAKDIAGRQLANKLGRRLQQEKRDQLLFEAAGVVGSSRRIPPRQPIVDPSGFRMVINTRKTPRKATPTNDHDDTDRKRMRKSDTPSPAAVQVSNRFSVLADVHSAMDAGDDDDDDTQIVTIQNDAAAVRTSDVVAVSAQVAEGVTAIRQEVARCEQTDAVGFLGDVEPEDNHTDVVAGAAVADDDHNDADDGDANVDKDDDDVVAIDDDDDDDDDDKTVREQAQIETTPKITVTPAKGVKTVFSQVQSAGPAVRRRCLSLDRAPTTLRPSALTMRNQSGVIVFTGGDKNDWKIVPDRRTKVLVVGDSNLRKVTPIPSGWEVHCLPGGKLQHMNAALKDLLLRCSTELAVVYVQAGINHRDQQPDEYRRHLEQLMMLNCQTSVEIAFVGVPKSRSLTPTQRENIDALNDLTSHAFADQFVQPIPEDQVEILQTDTQKIHHTAYTTGRIMSSIRKHAQLHRHLN